MITHFKPIYENDELKFSQGTQFNAENAKKVFDKYGLVEYSYASTVDHVDVPRILKTGSHRTHTKEKPVTCSHTYFDHPIWLRDANEKSYLVCHAYISDKDLETVVMEWAKFYGLKCEAIDNWYGFTTTAFIIYA